MLPQEIALKLDVPPRQLELASLQAYLEHELRLVESEMLRLAHKYGIQTVQELDQLVQQGQVHKANAFEDYFELDYLESKRGQLRLALKSLA